MELINDTLGGLLEKWAQEQPDHDFLVYPDRNLRFSYRQFNERVDTLAKALLEIGVTKGSKVGVWAKNVPDWLTFMFASARIGAVLVTVNTNYKAAELKYIMQDADIHTMCLVNGYRDSDYVQIMYEVVPELRSSERGRLHSDEFPELRNVVYIGQEKQRGMYTTAELLTMGSYASDEALLAAKAQVNPFEEVNMQYTSGTTGFPKGVMLTQPQYPEQRAHDRRLHALHEPADKATDLCAACSTASAACWASAPVITHGSTMVMVEDFDPLKVLASVHRERCTALLRRADDVHRRAEPSDVRHVRSVSSLRTGIMAGAPCPIETMKQVMEKMYCKDIISVYGLTESSPGMTATRVTDSPEIRATTVGRSLPFVEVKVLDPETNKECPVGVQGEMCCKGYNIMKGYYKNPEATAAIIDENGFLHSGDLGVMDENGYFRITGRLKDMIIRGGENIYPREIENFLFRMPQIESVEVGGIPSPKYGEEVGAFIKVKEGQTLTEEEIKLFCRGQIARYKIPKYIFFVDSYPMTASGKIQKYKLKDWGLEMLRDRGVEVI